MRVITGTARGRRLVTVPGNDIARPTSEKVKEGLFSSIQFDIEGRKVLDLFAGCGQLGIEALSRGASSCTFVDTADASVKVIKQNVLSCGFEDCSKILKSDFSSFLLRCNEKFDIVFLDPPYKSGVYEKAIEGIANILSNYGKILCEHSSELCLPENISGLKAVKNLTYGNTVVTVYQKGDNGQ